MRESKNTIVFFIIILCLLFVAIGFVIWRGHGIIDFRSPTEKNNSFVGDITNFEDCVAAGYAVMESYPRQCRAGGQVYVENVGNVNELVDIIQINSPKPNDVISSPLTVSGMARGTWFFEATFPVVLVNWDGLIIAQGYATAQDEWMTEDFVPYTATLTFEKPNYGKNGALILQRSNPSGLPENDNALEIPIFFE